MDDDAGAFYEYPGSRVDELRTQYLVAFIVIVVIAVSLITAIVGSLAVTFCCCRKNSCTFSQRRKELKYEVHKHNQAASVQLMKAQRKLRYLAGHENMSDKNVLINMMRLAKESEVIADVLQDEDGSVIADRTATTILSENDTPEDKPPSYNIMRDKQAKKPVQLEELGDPPVPPPSYVYPKHLLLADTD